FQMSEHQVAQCDERPAILLVLFQVPTITERQVGRRVVDIVKPRGRNVEHLTGTESSEVGPGAEQLRKSTQVERGDVHLAAERVELRAAVIAASVVRKR